MPFVAGTYTITSNSFAPSPVTGTTISSSAAQSTWSDLSTGLSTCLLKDGSQTVTSNIPMGTFKFTGLGAGSALTDSANLQQVQYGFGSFLTSVSGTNTISATATPTPAYTIGQRFTFIPANTNTAATTLNISSVGAGAVQFAGAALTGGEIVVGVPVTVYVSAATPVFEIVTAASIVDNTICEGRLTLTTAVPVTTGDVAAAETVYFTPYKGNRLSLYNGTVWKTYQFTEVSVDVPDATAMNDVFIYDSSGTLTLDVTAWTNDTTRATALVLQNGVLVKSGATSRRYLGSFYATTAGNGQTEDSFANRYLWNYYNRVERPMQVIEATNSWEYSTATYQQANASTANQLNFCIGVSEDMVQANLAVVVASSTTTNRNVAAAIGLDSTTVLSGIAMSLETTTVRRFVTASYKGFPGIGKHYLAWLEQGAGTDTQTWYGDNGAAIFQSGIHGVLKG